MRRPDAWEARCPKGCPWFTVANSEPRAEQLAREHGEDCMGRDACPIYSDGVHCFVPGVLRTVSAGGDESFMTDWYACLPGDHQLVAAKRCECGATVRGSARTYPRRGADGKIVWVDDGP